jgi:hypothetical protein
MRGSANDILSHMSEYLRFPEKVLFVHVYV